MSEELPPHLQGQEEEDIAEQAEPVQTERDESPDPLLPRPNALYLRGVDNLDTRAIKQYVDLYVRPDYSYETREKYAKFSYRLEWVNDESINIVFVSGEEADEATQEALRLLSDETVDLETIDPLQERPARKFGQKKEGESVENVIESSLATEDTAKLYVRQAKNGDRKVKNARMYSRYYLIHGEPEYSERLPGARDRQRGRRSGRRDDRRDLITGEEPENGVSFGKDVYRPDGGRSDDEYRSRDRSPDDYRRGRGRHVDTYRPDNDDRPRRRGGRRSRNRYRERRGDEDDLFPDFFKDREREHSPSRMEE